MGKPQEKGKKIPTLASSEQPFMGASNTNCGYSVESPGIEPGSKQATKELSTGLFPD